MALPVVTGGEAKKVGNCQRTASVETNVERGSRSRWELFHVKDDVDLCSQTPNSRPVMNS